MEAAREDAGTRRLADVVAGADEEWDDESGEFISVGENRRFPPMLTHRFEKVKKRRYWQDFPVRCEKESGFFDQFQYAGLS